MVLEQRKAEVEEVTREREEARGGEMLALFAQQKAERSMEMMEKDFISMNERLEALQQGELEAEVRENTLILELNPNSNPKLNPDPNWRCVRIPSFWRGRNFRRLSLKRMLRLVKSRRTWPSK